ncbi:MAG: YceI family protein [Candidatus Eisenbacteria bacterium]|uniref:YceI family protein n=1 Tax=Eiseniibacteriota bacterium TaxID=2212470 RepID=A0A948WCJ5_UNCEI|nr:YceI family protein [Candidatus Eisenbacteria bacterium]MBU1948673.1 YceI family protein [Candidatus Eisenbacteria bacterium]MBU2690983.1 YceI family protein [Candidatus Eisenbacteria bacterium]
MKTKWIGSLAALVALIILSSLSSAALAAEKSYVFGKSDQRTNISFQSDTDFEVIVGTSVKSSGDVTADFEKETAKVNISVPVASLKTGIDMRDEHMRSPGWLDAAQFPSITFVSSSVKLMSGMSWEVKGMFTMHGVSKEIMTTAEVRQIPADAAIKAGLEPGEWIKVTAPFNVKLSDFGVKIPDMAAAKVNDTWKVTFTGYAVAGE